MPNDNKKEKQEQPKITKENVKALSDEDLDKVAGGFCDPGCIPVDNGCFCDESW